MSISAPPQNPAGEFRPEPGYSDARRAELIAEIEQAPARLAAAVAGLSDAQLNTKYRNWTIRQIARHLAGASFAEIYAEQVARTRDVRVGAPSG